MRGRWWHQLAVVSLCASRASSASAFLCPHLERTAALPHELSPPRRRREILDQTYLTCRNGKLRSPSIYQPSTWRVSRHALTTTDAARRRGPWQLKERDAAREGTDDAPVVDEDRQGALLEFQTIGVTSQSSSSLTSRTGGVGRTVPKKPRFVQAVHQQLQGQQQSQRMLVVGGEKDACRSAPGNERGRSSSREAGAPYPKSPSEPRTFSKRSRRISAASATHNSAVIAAAAPRYDHDRMWKRSKSIEELELSLTKRWGTDARPWTDYDDDDNGLDEDSDDAQLTSQGSSSRSSIASLAVRIRPVRDPWETQFDDSDSADPDRGRRRRRRSSKSESEKFLVSDLIRNRPVGGRGTLRDPAPPAAAAAGTVAAPSGDASGSSKPGFFFRPPTSVPLEAAPNAGTSALPRSRPSTATGQEQCSSVSSPLLSTLPTRERSREVDPSRAPRGTATTTRRSPPAQSNPLYDEDDGVTPLFLTIEQAQKNLEKARMHLPGGDEERQNDSDNDFKSDAFLSSTLLWPATSSWQDLGVTSPTLLENLQRMGCHRPLAVQQASLEFLMTPLGGAEASSSDIMKDLVIGTMTGSGKTLSFLVPLAQRMLDNVGRLRSDLLSQRQVLIVAPGRELASQIVSVARDLLQGTDLTVQLAIGGTTYTRNLEAIRKRKPHIIVGTPGRLAELMVGRPGESRGRLSKIFKPQTLVLDEFDALLEYKPHREKTLALLQVLKLDASLHTIACSATASDMMMASDKPGASSSCPPRRTVIDEYLRPGYQVAMVSSRDALATSDPGASGINTHVSRTAIHGVVHVPHRRYALETLRRVLNTEPLPQQVLVFVQDARKVKIVVERLERNGIIAAPLSGDDDKTDRADVSRALREGYVGLVVATELAARGLDAPLLTHVINMDLPTDASHYAHRAGRCGRGDRPGVVINLTTMPQERAVPRKFADKLGIDMYTVEVRNGKLNIVDPSTQTVDAL